MSEGDVNVGAWVGGAIGIIIGLIILGYLIRYVTIYVIYSTLTFYNVISQMDSTGQKIHKRRSCG